MPHESYSDTNNQNAQPALRADTFLQEQHGAQGAGGVAQCRHWNDKTHTFDGQHRQKRKERYRHHRNANPRPTHTRRPENKLNERGGPEVVNLTDNLHRAGNTEFTAGARSNNYEK